MQMLLDVQPVRFAIDIVAKKKLRFEIHAVVHVAWDSSVVAEQRSGLCSFAEVPP